MSLHKIITELEISFPGTDPDERETVWPEVEIEFSFTAGSPETGPSYSSGGEPATPDEIEVMSVKVLKDEGINMIHGWWVQKAQDWLDDDGYDAARGEACADNEPDPDDARDRAREDREMDRDFGGDDW